MSDTWEDTDHLGFDPAFMPPLAGMPPDEKRIFPSSHNHGGPINVSSNYMRNVTAANAVQSQSSSTHRPGAPAASLSWRDAGLPPDPFAPGMGNGIDGGLMFNNANAPPPDYRYHVFDGARSAPLPLPQDLHTPGPFTGVQPCGAGLSSAPHCAQLPVCTPPAAFMHGGGGALPFPQDVGALPGQPSLGPQVNAGGQTFASGLHPGQYSVQSPGSVQFSNQHLWRSPQTPNAQSLYPPNQGGVGQLGQLGGSAGQQPGRQYAVASAVPFGAGGQFASTGTCGSNQPSPNSFQYTPPMTSPQACAPVSLSSERSSKKGRGEGVPLFAKNSAAMLLQQCQELHVKAKAFGIPPGPLTGTHLELKELVKGCTINVDKGQGGFPIRIGHHCLDGLKGTVCELLCSTCYSPENKFHSSDEKCRMRYEYTGSGWVLYEFNASHVHALSSSKAETMVSASGRQVSPEFDELGSLLAESGFSAKDIVRVFQTKSKREGNCEPMFNYEDVYSKFIRSTAAARALDVTGVLEHLVLRRERNRLLFFHEADALARMERLFVECAGAQDVWGTRRTYFQLQNVLLFDATFGTNCYRMKLSIFVTVTAHGCTKILAYVIHHEEDCHDVLWAFKCFHETFKVPPATLLTDSGSGILAAGSKMIEVHWHYTVHLLCVFHIDQNFYSHIHPLFASSKSNWKVVHDMFWRLAKDSDVAKQGSFAADFDAMKQYVDQQGRGQTKSQALKWMQDVLLEKAQQWVACFTWQHFSAGAHASQRSESTFSAVKTWLISNSSLMKLHEKVETYDQFKEFKDSCVLQQKLCAQARLSMHLPVWLQQISELLSPYAMQLMRAQLSQVFMYQVSTHPDKGPGGETQYSVRRTDGAIGVDFPALVTSGPAAARRNPMLLRPTAVLLTPV